MRTFKNIFFIMLIITGLGFAQVKYTWNGGTGSWQTASNWNPNGIPGAADTAVVNSGTVTNDQLVTIANLFQNGATINGTGDIIITKKFTFTAGTQGGTGTTTISSTGTGIFTTQNGKTISRIFVIDGLLEVQNSGAVSFSTGAQVVNNGTIDFQININFGNSNGTIVNNGTLLNSSAGGGIIAAPFTNNGTINVQSGELSSSGGISGSGSFVIAEGRKFRVTGGTSTIGGNSISGSGTFELVNATLNISGSTVTVASGTTFLQTSGTIEGDGSLIINGTINWVSGTQGGTGTTTIASTGTGIFTIQNGKTLSRIFVIDGLLEVQSSGAVSFSTGAQVVNNGTIDFQTIVNFGNSTGTIVNNGTIINSSAGGGGILGAPFTNNGTVNVQSGELSSSGGITGSGSFVIAEGRKFKITSGTSTIGGNSISGSGTFEIQSATLNITGNAVTISSGTTLLQTSGIIDGDGSLIINGTINWVSGTQGGTGTTRIASTGTGIFTTQNGKTISRIFVIDGLLEVQNSGAVSFSTGAQVVNNGTIDFQININFGNSNGTIVNNGTLLNSSAGGGIIAAPFTNNGIVQIVSGAMSFSDTLKNNITAEIKGVGTLTTPTGNRFINNGTISPGLSPGIMRINGNYPQTSDAALNIEIGGYVVGSERDSLAITQQAQLGGTLNIKFINDFLPQVGDVFTIIGYNSRSGEFAQINFLDSIAGQIQYLSNGAQIIIGSATSVEDEIEQKNENETNNIPDTYELSQNYPNPFNPSTTISWQSPTSSYQTLKIYDVLGNEIATLVNEEKPAGVYEINFNASNLASGIYFYKIQAGSFLEIKKMLLLK